jgi:hypothetical protein
MGKTLPCWQLYVADSMEAAAFSIDSVSLFLRSALSLTARKQFHETTWPLRANPSIYRKNKNPFQKEKRVDGHLTLMGVVSLKLKWPLRPKVGNCAFLRRVKESGIGNCANAYRVTGFSRPTQCRD